MLHIFKLKAILLALTLSFSGHSIAKSGTAVLTTRFKPLVVLTVDTTFGNSVNFDLSGGGLFVEIVRLTLSEMGHEVQFLRFPLKRVLDTSKRGNYFGAFPFLQDPKRKADFLFSDPIHSYRIETLVLKSSKIQSIDKAQVKAMKTCDSIGSLLYKKVQQYVDVTFEMVRSGQPQCFILLDKGRIDFMFHPEDRGNPIRPEYKIVPNDLDIFVSAHFLIPRKYPDAEILLTKFNQAMHTLKSKGVIATLQKKYSAIGIKPQP